MNETAAKHTLDARVAALVFCCFLLTSEGWLLWTDHLATMVASGTTNLLTLVVSYLVQALGVVAYLACARRYPRAIGHVACAVYACGFAACLVPALLADLVPCIVFGMGANLLCGMLQAHYFHCLAALVRKEGRGTVFGGAYAASTMVSWALSKITVPGLGGAWPGIALCALLAAFVTMLLLHMPSPEQDANGSEDSASRTRLVPFACLLVVLMSATKGLGYGFPSQDLTSGIDLATSRLFYGAGLLAAGVVGDRDRTYGAFCCICSLVTPFLSMALMGAAVPAAILWALGYFLFGFFSVYRTTLLADLAADVNVPYLAAAGLLFGRVGDAVGEALRLAAQANLVVLICVASALFVATMMVLLAYMRASQDVAGTSTTAPTEQELFDAFWRGAGLSERQAEVLRLILDGCSNQQISSQLVVSQNTVKFHVRNVLKKTGCRNRQELQMAWSRFCSRLSG